MPSSELTAPRGASLVSVTHAAPAVSASAAPAAASLGVLAYRGLRAQLLGQYRHLALELAGPDVAVRGVWAALVDRRGESKEPVRLNGTRFQLEEGSHRIVTASVDDGMTSAVILNERVVRWGLAELSTAGRAGRVPVVCAASSVGPNGLPADFGAVFHRLVPLPNHRSWSPFLWTLGQDHGLIETLSGAGSLRGYALDVSPQLWAPHLPIALRAARAARAGIH